MNGKEYAGRNKLHVWPQGRPRSSAEGLSMGGLSPSVRAHVSASGRLYIPSRLRGLVGLERGGSVVVRVENGELRVRTVQDVMAELQAESLALFAGSGESVDAFLADRHVKAATENET